MNIPMLDLYAQYRSIKKEIDFAIKNVIGESAFVGGKYVEKFENEIAKYCGTKYAVAVNSGTDALYLALWSLGIGNGDEVITTPFSFFATAEIIVRLGAKPMFVDIDQKTFNINPYLIERKISKKTKAILPVHLFGLPAEMDKINKLAKKYNLFVIEDACQAIGAKYDGKKTGNLADIGCFSFFPSKNIGAYGDGGMVTTNNKTIAEKIIMMRNHGSKVKYHNELIGLCSRLDGIQAAILSVKLKHLNQWNKKRSRVAQTYNKLLKDIPCLVLPDYNRFQLISTDSNHIFHQYTIRITNGKRNKLKDYLKSKGISSMIYYPIPLHLLKAMKYLGYKKGSFPKAEKASEEVLSLPMYPELTTNQIKYICNKIVSFA
jgi:dTDP-4-amino-4,6-dideoxygalactose transaminase